MERPKVEEWREHLERNLKVIAESWSKLAGPVARIRQLLEGVHDGDSFKMTKEFLDLVETLQGEIGICPIIKDGPTTVPCRPDDPFIPVGPHPAKGGPGDP